MSLPRRQIRCAACDALTETFCAEHSSLAAEASLRAAGFEITGKLGRGGFASVFLAREGGQVVAVKLAHRPRDPRFAREAEALARLGAPWTPVLIRDGALADQRPFLVMEYVGTDSLATRMTARQSPARLTDIATWLSELSAVIDRLHASGVIHRDLKPAHVVYRASGHPTVLDFGLAAFADGPLGESIDPSRARLTRSGEWMGTCAYMAPEQYYARGDVDWRADLYALGVMLFEQLADRLPFVGSQTEVSHAHALARCPAPSELRPTIPASVDRTVLKALAKHREQRFQTARALSEAFGRACHPGDPARGGAISTRAAETPARARLIAVISACVPRAAVACRKHIAAAGAEMVCAGPNECVIALPWAPSTAVGVRQAVILARQIDRSHGGGCVVHVARLHVRARTRGVTVLGPGIADRAHWQASPERRGVVVTRVAAGYLDAHEVIKSKEEFMRIRPTAPIAGAIEPRRVPVRGRDRVTDAIHADIERALAGFCHLITLTGQIGMGKTRVLNELARELRTRPDVQVIHVTPTRDQLADDCAQALLYGLGVSPDAIATSIAQPHRHGHTQRGELAGVLTAVLCQKAQERPVIVLIDDAHQAEHAVLDAVEMATSQNDCPLGVIISAPPAWLAMRTRWGARARSHRRYTLDRLELHDARTLLIDLLRPVELVPEPVLSHLYELADGVPLYLVELARALRDRGAIRAHADMPGYYLAADEITRATHTLVGETIARRVFDALPAPLIPFVELIAVMQRGFTADDVVGVQAILAARPDRDPAVAIDPSRGLENLHAKQILSIKSDKYYARPDVLWTAIEAGIAPMRKRALHAAAFEYWLGVSDAPDDRVARHAAGCGAGDHARAAYVRLAEHAHARHRHVHAQRYYSAALDHMAPDHPDRGAALAGRGRVHYRLQRFDDALTDLRQAQELAARRGDDVIRVELALEEARILHWCDREDESGRVAERAVAEIDAIGARDLAAGADLARGRICYERQELDAALPLLYRAARQAADSDDYDTQVSALLLLAPALVYCERLDEAEARFAEIFALCEAAGDAFYLATAYVNRPGLWIKRGDVARGCDDLTIGKKLARDLGNLQLERLATFNLAELLYWHGEFDRARPLAERSRALVTQFVHPQQTYHDHLLLARIACAQGDPGARRYVDFVEAHCAVEQMAPLQQALLELVQLATSAFDRQHLDELAWRGLAERARASSQLEELIEVLVLASEVSSRLGLIEQARRWLDQAHAAAASSPIWQPRLNAVTQRL